MQGYGLLAVAIERRPEGGGLTRGGAGQMKGKRSIAGIAAASGVGNP